MPASMNFTARHQAQCTNCKGLIVQGDPVTWKRERGSKATLAHANCPPRFALGEVVATPGAVDALDHHDVVNLLKRHQQLDQGELDAEDHARNKQALLDGSRVFSSYLVHGTKIWVITEADRSVTTLLLPEEY